ncbi:MAG: alkaline phosphatase D family protein [Roseiflexaceae bacterium]|nr:alkaline phosphatase D family protein [Roseiflexaceae bacterium]
MPTNRRLIDRRNFLRGLVGAATTVAASTILPTVALASAPAQVVSDNLRPQITSGIATGDITAEQALIWSKTDRPAQLLVDLATNEQFRDARTIQGPIAQASSDYTAKLNLSDLQAGQQYFYRVRFQDPKDARNVSEPQVGRFRSSPADRRNISFVWSADTAGQGWGINPDLGGMKIYNTMAWFQPDFFIHSGDTIYADNPIRAEVKLANGTIWKNVTTEAKSKVAETLQEFRGNFAYNLLDNNVRYFNSITPMFGQWDDHEVVNNWWPGQILNDPRYAVKDVSLLAARAKQAFLEYVPVRGTTINRTISYGPLLDVFMLDMRSYRAPNGPNDQLARTPGSDFLGRNQIRWLKQALLASDATWKVIAADMPIGLVIFDNFVTRQGSEAVANNDPGEPRGRELEIVDLLRFIKYNEITNVVWLTADVHYTAAHYYDPNKAAFSDFNPFYEFVSGPLNSGTFGPNDLDKTFGPQVVFQKIPPTGQVNLPPSAGMQFFGQVQIDGQTGTLKVTLRDVAGSALYTQVINPV